ncbi:MAG: DUF2029 domain-containing protein [Bacteroidales bacterium]|jgi:hypothetical protein|nr:DUF2029 domain-containing protein [Bacteroidales bacterium]
MSNEIKWFRFFHRPVFRNFRVIFIVWMTLAVMAGISKYMHGESSCGNYLTYRQVAVDLLHENPVYTSEHVLYGPVFGLVMSPFAFLPDWLGIALWLAVLSSALFAAVRKLPLSKGQQAGVCWICVHELMTASFNMQFNIGIAAIIVSSFVLIEKEKDVWAALVIVLGTLTKLYGVVGLAFFLFSKHRMRLALSLAGWAVVLFVLPMAFTSPAYIVEQYGDWVQNLIAKNAANNTHTGASLMQNISLLGMVQRIFGTGEAVVLPLLLTGAALFALPFLRSRQYGNPDFRLAILASTLLFTVLFSTSSESSTYIIAFAGVAVWFVRQPQPFGAWQVFLLIFVMTLSSLSPTDLFPRGVRETWVIPYSLKALPCALVWITLTVQLCRRDFSPSTRVPQ